jgi:hypothetical protein
MGVLVKVRWRGEGRWIALGAVIHVSETMALRWIFNYHSSVTMSSIGLLAHWIFAVEALLCVDDWKIPKFFLNFMNVSERQQRLSSPHLDFVILDGRYSRTIATTIPSYETPHQVGSHDTCPQRSDATQTEPPYIQPHLRITSARSINSHLPNLSKHHERCRVSQNQARRALTAP